MEYIVFSDIHSNIEAFNAFREVSAQFKGATPVCLGDIAGYAASPNECIEGVREMGCATIAGNHDFYIAREVLPSIFNISARKSLKWQLYVVSDENKEWLSSLPEEHVEEAGDSKILFIHGSPARLFDYIISGIDARRAAISMLKRGITLAFVGHTHKPGAWVYRGLRDNISKASGPDFSDAGIPAILREIDKSEREFTDMRIVLRQGDLAIVNVGSIGQPRDNDPRGCFVTYDTETSVLEFHKFEYDIEAARNKIITAGLPESLAARLGGKQ